MMLQRSLLIRRVPVEEIQRGGWNCLSLYFHVLIWHLPGETVLVAGRFVDSSRHFILVQDEANLTVRFSERTEKNQWFVGSETDFVNPILSFEWLTISLTTSYPVVTLYKPCFFNSATDFLGSSSWSFPNHISFRYTAVSRTSLDEGSARSRDLYLTTHHTLQTQTSMLPAGFEPEVQGSDTKRRIAAWFSRNVCHFIPEDNSSSTAVRMFLISSHKETLISNMDTGWYFAIYWMYAISFPALWISQHRAQYIYILVLTRSRYVSFRSVEFSHFPSWSLWKMVYLSHYM